jgi:phosphate transport system permease protein
MNAQAQTREPRSLIGRVRGTADDSWSLGDKIGLASAWAAGLFLCLVAISIVLYMFVRGIQYLNLSEVFSHPQAGLDQSKSGGFLDPLEGTLLLTVLATLIAAPIGIGIAVWLTEYGRPSGLARAVESGVEIVAGTPSIVLAIFGLLVFQQGVFSFLSYEATPGVAFGRSFFAAGMIMSLIALPLIVGASREALYSIPRHVREAS